MRNYILFFVDYFDIWDYSDPGNPVLASSGVPYVQGTLKEAEAFLISQIDNSTYPYPVFKPTYDRPYPKYLLLNKGYVVSALQGNTEFALQFLNHFVTEDQPPKLVRPDWPSNDGSGKEPPEDPYVAAIADIRSELLKAGQVTQAGNMCDLVFEIATRKLSGHEALVKAAEMV